MDTFSKLKNCNFFYFFTEKLHSWLILKKNCPSFKQRKVKKEIKLCLRNFQLGAIVGIFSMKKRYAPCCVACVSQRRHIGITIRRLASSSVVVVVGVTKFSVTFFSQTTQASFLIFGTEHQYGGLYRVRYFPVWRISTSCLAQLRLIL